MEGEDLQLGLDCFRDLTYGQQVLAIYTVANGLLREDVRSVELTAVLEGAIGAIFRYLEDEIQAEIDDNRSYFRELIVAARKELGMDEVPNPHCPDMSEWRAAMEGLHDAILFDTDYECGSEFVDLSPERAAVIKRLMEIDDAHYTAIIDDPKEEEIELWKDRLRQLLRSVE